MSKGWERMVQHEIMSMPARGWRGVWDALIAWITGRPQKMYRTPVVFSVYVKAPEGAEVKLCAQQIVAGWKD